ncbi:MAG TPA: hypothetical protein VND22_01710, partial [Actinomycetota bacterium]|nr:hypothetical protein [Actinomycetota bacterium]
MGRKKNPKTVVLVDGEHYPKVVARALRELEEQGENLVLALLVGGGEKLGQEESELGVELEIASKDPEAALAKALDDHGATRVIDISDEPVLGYTARFRLA